MSSEARHSTWHNGKLCRGQLDIGPKTVEPEDEYRFSAPSRAVSLGVPTMAAVWPILEFPRGQGMNGNDSQDGGVAVT